MAGSSVSSHSPSKKKVIFLKNHEIDLEVAIGLLMHLFLFLCLVILLYLLAKEFQLL